MLAFIGRGEVQRGRVVVWASAARRRSFGSEVRVGGGWCASGRWSVAEDTAFNAHEGGGVGSRRKTRRRRGRRAHLARALYPPREEDDRVEEAADRAVPHDRERAVGREWEGLAIASRPISIGRSTMNGDVRTVRSSQRSWPSVPDRTVHEVGWRGRGASV